MSAGGSGMPGGGCITAGEERPGQREAERGDSAGVCTMSWTRGHCFGTQMGPRGDPGVGITT